MDNKGISPIFLKWSFLAVAILLVLSDCGTKRFILYSDHSLSKDEIATLCLTKKCPVSRIWKIEEVNGRKIRGCKCEPPLRACQLYLLPGNHEIRVKCSSGYFLLMFNAEAGFEYSLECEWKRVGGDDYNQLYFINPIIVIRDSGVRVSKTISTMDKL